ncbi:hypothetical protein IWQ55_000999 [Labrenzia sp. EL_208]|nr:hypothetical protein [Labrenzia sp. EL_132]MBG6227801.1 hypothetical protein [Labrenzia sp. EL_208]
MRFLRKELRALTKAEQLKTKVRHQAHAWLPDLSARSAPETRNLPCTSRSVRGSSAALLASTIAAHALIRVKDRHRFVGQVKQWSNRFARPSTDMSWKCGHFNWPEVKFYKLTWITQGKLQTTWEPGNEESAS